MNLQKPTDQDYEKDHYLIQKQKLDLKYEKDCLKLIDEQKLNISEIEKEKSKLDKIYNEEVEKLKIKNQIDVENENLKQLSSEMADPIPHSISFQK